MSLKQIGTIRLPRRQAGVTLLEVLVAALILSIGLLGVAGLQAVGLRHNQNSQLRSMAVVMAQDLVDRMRANPVGVRDTTMYDSIDSESVATDPGCAATGCTPIQLATLDIVQWVNNSVKQVPGMSAKVERGTDDVFTLTVTWMQLADDLDSAVGTDAAKNLTSTTVYFVAPEL